jgi:hypothetical protein
MRKQKRLISALVVLALAGYATAPFAAAGWPGHSPRYDGRKGIDTEPIPKPARYGKKPSKAWEPDPFKPKPGSKKGSKAVNTKPIPRVVR